MSTTTSFSTITIANTLENIIIFNENTFMNNTNNNIKKYGAIQI